MAFFCDKSAVLLTQQWSSVRAMHILWHEERIILFFPFPVVLLKVPFYTVDMKEIDCNSTISIHFIIYLSSYLFRQTIQYLRQMHLNNPNKTDWNLIANTKLLHENIYEWKIQFGNVCIKHYLSLEPFNGTQFNKISPSITPTIRIKILQAILFVK